MKFPSVESFALHLISSAFQRCRLSQQLCRLSVALNASPSSHPPLVRVSISDTGMGSCLEEFQHFKFSGGAVDENWDGMISIKTTGISDVDILHYQLNAKESQSRRRIKSLPSTFKNGAKFSGTEVCFSISTSLDLLIAQTNSFFQKILILGLPNVAVELVVEQGQVSGLDYRKVFLANESNLSPLSPSNLELMASGFEAYVLKHGNSLNNKCDSCFPTGNYLRVGRGVAYSNDRRYPGLVMEFVLIFSEISEPDTACPRECGFKTEVLCFKDFSPCSITQPFMKSLKCFDWKNYGLNLGSITLEDGMAVIEWENLPPDAHIDFVFHYYENQTIITSERQKTRLDRNLIKKVIKLSLDDLKEKHAGFLLSSHAVKICSYAPDLASSIAGLILSSNDSDFQEECFSLLGLELQSQGADDNVLENSIKEKIISVVEMNDRRPQKRKDIFLFEDERFQDLDSHEMEYEGVDDVSSLDI